jgi:hypothetical protein
MPGDNSLCLKKFADLGLRGFLVFFEGGGVRERFPAVHRSSSPHRAWSWKQLPQYCFTRSKGNVPETFSEVP